MSQEKGDNMLGNGMRMSGGAEEIKAFKKRDKELQNSRFFDRYFSEEVLGEYLKQKKNRERVAGYKKELDELIKKKKIDPADEEAIRSEIFNFLKSKNAGKILKLINESKEIIQQSEDEGGEKDEETITETETGAVEVEKEETGYVSKKDFFDKYESSVFYMDKNTGQEIQVLDFNPKTKKVLVRFYDNFEIGQDSGGKNVFLMKKKNESEREKEVSFDEFEKMMENYISTNSLDQEADREERRRKYRRPKGRKFKVFDLKEDIRGKEGVYISEDGKIELAVKTYKKGERKGNATEHGTFSVYINGKSQGFWSAANIEDYIKDNNLEYYPGNDEENIGEDSEKEIKEFEQEFYPDGGMYKANNLFKISSVKLNEKSGQLEIFIKKIKDGKISKRTDQIGFDEFRALYNEWKGTKIDMKKGNNIDQDSGIAAKEQFEKEFYPLGTVIKDKKNGLMLRISNFKMKDGELMVSIDSEKINKINEKIEDSKLMTVDEFRKIHENDKHDWDIYKSEEEYEAKNGDEISIESQGTEVELSKEEQEYFDKTIVPFAEEYAEEMENWMEEMHVWAQEEGIERSTVIQMKRDVLKNKFWPEFIASLKEHKEIKGPKKIKLVMERLKDKFGILRS